MYTFDKEERICSKKLLDKLFSEGRSFMNYPFKVTFLIYPLLSNYAAQTVFVVSKRRFKKAVDRNRIKRLIRESFRLNKSSLYNILNDKNIKILISINYIANEELNFHQLEAQMKSVILKFKTHI